MFHVLAWGIPYFGPMTGNKLVMPGMGMEGESVCELIDKEEVNSAFGVPTVWMQLLAYCRDNNKILSTVKNTIIGGSAVSLAMIKEFNEVHHVNVIHAWGMTEMSPLGTTNLPTPEMETMNKDEKYAIQLKQGRPVYGVELKIVDDSGDDLPNDGEAYGHLMVRGPWILQKYFKAEKDAVDEEGWFDTGDISSIDQDGYMTIVDRSKDVIKTGGEWISSIDLENAAVGHPEIAEACVVGVPHPKWDERPVMFVVTTSGDDIDKDSILDFLSSKVAKWWLPDEIIFLKEAGDSVEELRSNLGKTGYVITTAKTREEAIRINDLARQTIQIKVGEPGELTWEVIRNNARKKFYIACKACAVCDGVECAGKVPGIGGIGSGSSFTENLHALARYKVNLRTIHNVKDPDLSIDLFGQKLSIPILAAPITGMETNLAGGMDEKEYAASVVNGCISMGTVGMVGDGLVPTNI